MQITLTVIAGPHKGKAFTFADHDTFIVGSSPKAHFRLPFKDMTFSRVHFMVELNPPLCRVHDMGSKHGTYVNGQLVDSADLHDGDKIKGGKTVLRVALLEAAGETTVDYVYDADPPQPSAVQPGPARPKPAPAPRPVAATGNPAGPVVPGYRLVRELGRGGMGVVHLAEQEINGAPVALKIITPAGAPKPHQVQRFLREASILRDLDHPNIVRFREMGEANGLLYFAMEYVPGADAARWLRVNGPMPVRSAVRLLCQLLRALEYAHDKGFVHRDIKPGNMLLTMQDGKKVVKGGGLRPSARVPGVAAERADAPGRPGGHHRFHGA